jgi:translation initiation factor IF-3
VIQQKTLINNAIRARDMRVIGSTGDNLGVMTREDAIVKAKSSGLDLIEVSNNGEVCVCRIADYGKYQYDMSKKFKEVKAKSNVTETKNIQLSVGISENDIQTKVDQAVGWIKEGHRVKFELQLKGRGKYMEESFLKERLQRVLAVMPVDYKIAEPLKKMPKGFAVVLEKAS